MRERLGRTLANFGPTEMRRALSVRAIGRADQVPVMKPVWTHRAHRPADEWPPGPVKFGCHEEAG